MTTYESPRDPAERETGFLRIQQGLIDFNLAVTGEGAVEPVLLIAKDQAGEIIGGLTGERFWRWLHVEMLWVADEHRGRGHATELLGLAEWEARAAGCVHSYLNTFSFQAQPFYEKRGDSVFGVIEDFPPGHRRIDMTKPLGCE